MMKRLPNRVDWLQGELAVFLEEHSGDERAYCLVREALEKLDALIASRETSL